MLGHGGLFRQQNVEKRRVFSVREWAELCNREDRRAPGVDDIGLHYARRNAPPPPPKTRAKKGKPDVTKEAAAASPVSTPERLKEGEEENTGDDEGHETKPQTAKPKRKWQTREMREAHLAERAAADAAFMKSFNPRTDWLPPNTRSEDYTPEFCKDLERRFWRNCGFGTPAMYGADMEGRIRRPFFLLVS